MLKNDISPKTDQATNLDELNAWKLEMQKLFPLVELLKNHAPPSSLKGLERDQTLRIMGFDWPEIEKMTGFDRGLEMASSSIGELGLEEPEIVTLAKDCKEGLTSLNARVEAEREVEWNRISLAKMSCGWIEDEISFDPILKDSQHS